MACLALTRPPPSHTHPPAYIHTYTQVYCWQYLNCLRVWVAVLTAYCDSTAPAPMGGGGDDQHQQQLRELVFPLTQILIGVLRLAPSARHCPLLLHCLTLLQRLAAAAQVFVPCASTCLDLLESPALLGQKKPKPTTEAPPNLALAVRLGKGLLEPK
jgi:nucleolar complex protein 2